MRVKDRACIVHEGLRYHSEFLATCGVKLAVSIPKSWESYVVKDAIGEETEEPTTCLKCIGEQDLK